VRSGYRRFVVDRLSVRTGHPASAKIPSAGTSERHHRCTPYRFAEITPVPGPEARLRSPSEDPCYGGVRTKPDRLGADDLGTPGARAVLLGMEPRSCSSVGSVCATLM